MMSVLLKNMENNQYNIITPARIWNIITHAINPTLVIKNKRNPFQKRLKKAKKPITPLGEDLYQSSWMSKLLGNVSNSVPSGMIISGLPRLLLKKASSMLKIVLHAGHLPKELLIFIFSEGIMLPQESH
jgi:hypothetical protein